MSGLLLGILLAARCRGGGRGLELARGLRHGRRHDIALALVLRRRLPPEGEREHIGYATLLRSA